MGTQKIIHNNWIYLFLAGRNIHGLHGHIFTHICAQEKEQLQVSIELESLRSGLWCLTVTLMLCAEFIVSFQRFTTIIFVKICDLCKTFLIAYIYLIIILAIEHKLRKPKTYHLNIRTVNVCASCAGTLQFKSRAGQFLRSVAKASSL